jgi:hypothetical protein
LRLLGFFFDHHIIGFVLSIHEDVFNFIVDVGAYLLHQSPLSTCIEAVLACLDDDILVVVLVEDTLVKRDHVVTAYIVILLLRLNTHEID